MSATLNTTPKTIHMAIVKANLESGFSSLPFLSLACISAIL